MKKNIYAFVLFCFFSFASTYTFSQTSNYVYLDGINDYVNIFASPSVYHLKKGTVSFWFKMNNLVNYQVLFSVSDTTLSGLNSDFAGIDFRNLSGATYFEYAQANGGSGKSVSLSSPNVVNDYNWHHYALVADSIDSIAVYVDGNLITMNSGYCCGPIDRFLGYAVNANSMKIGVIHRVSFDFPGNFYMDDFCLYDTSLSSSDVQALYGKTFSDSSHRKIHYNFEDFENLSVGKPGFNDVRDQSGNGNHGDAFEAVIIRPGTVNTIRGNLFNDANGDCKMQASEKALSSVVVKAMPGPFYSGVDKNGGYWLTVDTGSVTYTLTEKYNSINGVLLQPKLCNSSYTVSLTGTSKDTCCFDFADSLKKCFVLDINIQKTSARQCIRGAAYVNYTNYGSLPATGAVVKIEYPSHIFPVASKPMWTSIQGSVLTYNIGTLQAGQSGQIIITDSVDCAVDLTHQVECIKATISPVSNCVANNPSWDRSSMKVTGSCQSANAHFVITNDGTGDMGSPLQYRVYENDTLIYTGTYQLKSGESFTVDYPAEGQSIRLEADQNSLHPGKSHPRATIENCGTPISGSPTTGLVTTAPLDDLDEEVAFTCPTITNSHDPNEKLAIPSGFGAAHNIAPGKEIEYVIGFQNTGNDTAYIVTVVDTLDADLDVASFIQGASSHPYTLGISGKGQAVLSFRFDQINLPDSTTNNLASSGLVSFRMTVPSNASIGTVIKNKAYIYFDYNTPVITNETMHTVDSTIFSNFSKGSLVQIGAVATGLTGKKFREGTKIYPNPTTGMITVEIPETGTNSELRILSMVGTMQKSVSLSGTMQQVSLEGLSQGLYLYEVWQNGERKTGGKLQVWF